MDINGLNKVRFDNIVIQPEELAASGPDNGAARPESLESWRQIPIAAREPLMPPTHMGARLGYDQTVLDKFGADNFRADQGRQKTPAIRGAHPLSIQKPITQPAADPWVVAREHFRTLLSKTTELAPEAIDIFTARLGELFQHIKQRNPNSIPDTILKGKQKRLTYWVNRFCEGKETSFRDVTTQAVALYEGYNYSSNQFYIAHKSDEPLIERLFRDRTLLGLSDRAARNYLTALRNASARLTDRNVEPRSLKALLKIGNHELEPILKGFDDIRDIRSALGALRKSVSMQALAMEIAPNIQARPALATALQMDPLRASRHPASANETARQGEIEIRDLPERVTLAHTHVIGQPGESGAAATLSAQPQHVPYTRYTPTEEDSQLIKLLTAAPAAAETEIAPGKKARAKTARKNKTGTAAAYASYLRHLSWLLQNSTAFPGSLTELLTLASSDDQIDSALRAVGGEGRHKTAFRALVKAWQADAQKNAQDRMARFATGQPAPGGAAIESRFIGEQPSPEVVNRGEQAPRPTTGTTRIG